MRSLSKKYFYCVSDLWASISSENYLDLHRVKYNNITCYFNGYGFYDEEGNQLFTYYHDGNFSPLDKFKLLSVITLKNGKKNYLGCNAKTGTLTTFDEDQITFNKINNEESI